MTAQTGKPTQASREAKIKRLRSAVKKREAALVSILELSYFSPIEKAQDIAAECLYGKGRRK